MKGFVVPFALLLIVLANSRLVTKSMMKEISEHNAQMRHPEYSDPNFTPQPGASALPVQGIANATSGYLPVAENSTAALYYIFYQCRGLQANQANTSVPIIIWLQGGPGGTSMLGNFFENGPYSIIFGANGKYAEAQKSSSWNDDYNMLYIDNPKAVGYSYLGNDTYVTNEDQVAADFVNALQNFYGLSTFAPFANTPLFIFGESYAGHYIPSISEAILVYNIQNPSSPFPLRGIGIGDGWTDPPNQLVNNDLFGFALGLIDFSGKAQVEFYQAAGINNINNQNWQAALSDFDEIMSIIASDGANLNVYNYRDFGDYNVDNIIDFMNYPNTCTRYNVNPYLCGSFVEINSDVYEALENDFMQTVAPRVGYVVEKIPVLLYNGQWDIIVNAPAAQNWINNLQWSGQQGFYNAPLNSWILNNGTVAGFNKTYGNLHFNLVNKAGHMSPHDQLESTIEMVNNYIGKVLLE